MSFYATYTQPDGTTVKTTDIINSPYTQQQVDAVPGLASLLTDAESYEFMGMPKPSWATSVTITSPETLKQQTAQTTVAEAVNNVASQYNRYLESPTQETLDGFQKARAQAESLGATPDSINGALQSATKDYQQSQETQKYLSSLQTGGGLSDILSNPVTQIALAYALPGIGADIGASLISNGVFTDKVIATAVGTALASTSIQVANGADFDTALKNATVTAVVTSGSPTVANDIAKAVGSTGVADAITSGGASIASTLAKGGSMDDALKNAGAAIAASGASQAAQEGDLSQQTSRDIGAAVGGALTGGVTGAITGLAGEMGRVTPTPSGTQVASAGDVISDPGVVSDSPTDVGLTEIVAPKDVGIGSTDVQIMDAIKKEAASAPVTPVTPVTTAAPVTTDSTNTQEVVVTAPKQPTDITATDIQTVDNIPTVDVTAKKEEVPTVTVTAPKLTPDITSTDIQVEDTTSTPVDKTAAPADKATTPAEPADEAAPYKPDLFIYGGSGPSTLSQSLSTTFQAPYYPSAAPQGLTASRGAGEIEGVESGKKRQNVWNEASLRLKDALGL
jgi:hypothetical protein